MNITQHAERAVRYEMPDDAMGHADTINDMSDVFYSTVRWIDSGEYFVVQVFDLDTDELLGLAR